MRFTGLGHDSLMAVVPLAVVFIAASIIFGGPGQVFHLLADYATEFARSAWDWLRWVL